MGTRQYVGARYVPKFATPIAWDNARTYEALEIVTYLGTSYTSKKPVPTGVEITNTEYWVVTGNYNAQVEEYRQEVQAVTTDVATLEKQVNWKTPEMYGAVGDGTTDDRTAIQAMLTDMHTGETAYFGNKYYISDYVEINTQGIAIVGGFDSPEYGGYVKVATSKNGFVVNSPCVDFRNITIIGTSDESQMAIGIYYNTDAPTRQAGDIDSFLDAVRISYANKGIVFRGKNASVKNSFFSHCVNCIELQQTSRDTENRGYIIESNRFHAWTGYAIENLINRSGVRNILIANNFADYGAGFYRGYVGETELISNNVYCSGIGAYFRTNSNAGHDKVISNCFKHYGEPVARGIYIEASCNKITIMDNVIEEFTHTGIDIGASAYCDVLYNRIINNGTAGSDKHNLVANTGCVGYGCYNVFTGTNGGDVIHPSTDFTTEYNISPSA